MASDAVVISDGDSGGVVESVMVELVTGRVGDRVGINESACPDSVTHTTCHLRCVYTKYTAHTVQCVMNLCCVFLQILRKQRRFTLSL